MRNTREVRDDGLPAEAAAMRIPPRNRWQVLLIEYELLDAYLSQLHQRVWTSGLFLVGLTMVGVGFLAPMLDAGIQESLNVIGLKRGEQTIVSPAADEVIRHNDLMIVVGDRKKAREAIEKYPGLG